MSLKWPVVISRERSVVFTLSKRTAQVSSTRCRQWLYSLNNGSRSPHFAPTEGDQRLFFPEVDKTNLLQNAYNRKTMRLDPGVLQLWVDPWVRRIYLRCCQINGSAYWHYGGSQYTSRHGNCAGGGSVSVSMSREFSLNDDQRFEYAHSCTSSRPIRVESYCHAHWALVDRWPCITRKC